MAVGIAVSDYKLTKKIQHGDPFWTTFNSSFQNVQLEPEKIIDAIWNGRAITTQHKNKWRTSENYLLGQHIGLDMDTEDDRSAIKTLAKDKFISKYAAFIHTTISHKTEAPRARVIFLLDTPIQQAKNYSIAATALLWLFGTADRQCKDAVRFFYGAPQCECEIIGQILPLLVVKDVIKKYIESGQAEHKRVVNPNYHAPADQEEVSAALRFIPAMGINYDEWVGVLMAIHSEFGDGGYALADSWAQGKPGEVDQKWRSFHKAGNVAGAVTIATVFGIAKRYGWSRSAA